METGKVCAVVQARVLMRWQERWRGVIFWKQNSCDFLMGWSQG